MIEHILLWQFTEQAKGGGRGGKAGVFAAAVCRIARAD